MHQLSNVIQLGPINTDDENRTIPSGDSRYSLNFRNGAPYITKGGAQTNVKGNVIIPTYLSPYGVPQGTSKTIGSFEDVINNTVIFLNCNSESEHGIYRYYPDKKDANNPYGIVEQVITYNFGWNGERVTSISYIPDIGGDLLYWIDNTGLRSINLDKANIVNKKKTWTIYLPQTNIFFQTRLPRIQLSDINGNQILDATVVLGTHETNFEGLTVWANSLNTNFGTKIFAKACECHLEITELGTNVFNYSLTAQLGVFPGIMVPDNWYGTSLTDQMFARVKEPPLYAPQAQYKQDIAFLPNLVKNKVFQFRNQYFFDTKDKSIVGVFSQIPINNLQCDGAVNDTFNYIDINFNNPEIATAETLVVLKRIGIIARELNDGVQKRVTDLEICDFLDYNFDTNQWFCHYRFYNNVQSTAISPDEAAKLDSGVPIDAKAELNYLNRMVDGGVTLGRNAPDCPVADYKIKIQDTPQQKLYKITGRIRVFNPYSNFTPPQTKPNLFNARNAILFDQQLMPDATVYPFFGGTNLYSGVFEVHSTWAYESRQKQQILPEGGWPVYLAGTNIFTISKQINIQDVSQRSDGSIDYSTDGTRQQVIDFYNSGRDVFSEFELFAPPGEYVIRLASHWCSYGVDGVDKLGKGFMYDLSAGTAYQGTSTYVWGIDDGTYKYDYEIRVTVTNTDVFAGEFFVSDLAVDARNIYSGISEQPVPSCCGYLIDAEGDVDIPRLQMGVRVEKTLEYLDASTTPTLQPYVQKISDHNGFSFFYAGIAPTGGLEATLKTAGKFSCLQVGGEMHAGSLLYFQQTEGLSALALLSNGTITTTFPSLVNHLEFIVPSDNRDIRGNSSTFIEGSVLTSNGTLLPGVTVLYTHGRIAVSNSIGGFQLLAWGDMRFGDFNNRIVDSLIYSLPIACSPSYPIGQIYLVAISPFGANIGSSPPPYSPTAVFRVPAWIVDEGADPSQKALKRGGRYQHVSRYYDLGGRFCSCTNLFNIYIPFETEDLGLYPNVVDSSGNSYPLGTFKGGKPSIEFTLNYTPPEYAAFYQIMRSTNEIYGRYLQWVANSVTYLSALETIATPEFQTDFSNGDAIAIKIQIGNVVTYSSQNPNSQIGYSFEQGDRVRIVYNRDLELIEGLYDFEITNYDEITQSIIAKIENIPFEIQSGFVIEIYRQQTLADESEKIFYEVGEVFTCTNPGHANNQHGTPAGTLTNGDTYWRGRVIPVNDDATNYSSNLPIIIEDASVSDFYPSLAQDIGRIGIIDANLKEIFYPSRLIVSNVFQSDSALNGLTTYVALNTKDQGRQYGEVQRLMMVGKVLHAIMKNNNVSNYIGVVSFQYAQSTQTVEAIADDFLGTQNPSLATLGTELPAAVVGIDSYIYGPYVTRKTVWRHAQDGNTEISRGEYQGPDGVHTRTLNYFKDLFQNGIWDAVAIYDKRYREYILTTWQKAEAEGEVVFIGENPSGELIATMQFPLIDIQVGDSIVLDYTDVNGIKISYPTNVTYAVDASDYTIVSAPAKSGSIQGLIPIHMAYRGQGKTVAWNESKNGWTTEYSFVPECYGTLGDNVYAFKNGDIWLQDANDVYNNFFGVQYSTKVTPVFNEEPLINKVWNALWMQQYQANNQCEWFSPRITNISNQQSRLKSANFVKKEEGWYIPFKRDLTDTSVTNPIVNGRVLRSSALEVELQNDSTNLVTLYAMRINWTISERQSR